MRRDYFRLDVQNVDGGDGAGDSDQPTLRIDFRGPDELLRKRLRGSDGEQLSATETDVAFRFQDALDDPDAAGVIGITNRFTGEFVLELNEDADRVMQFIRAAREYGRATGGSEGRYRIEIASDGDSVVTYEKRTFLVYDVDGNLLRSKSLIPSGVEL